MLTIPEIVNCPLVEIFDLDILSSIVSHVRDSDLFPLALSCKAFVSLCTDKNSGSMMWKTRASGSIARMQWAISQWAVPSTPWVKALVEDNDAVGIDWLVEQFGKRLIDNSVFKTAASVGHLELLTWLFKAFYDPTEFPDIDSVFKTAARVGHLEILTWLFKEFYDPTEFPDIEICKIAARFGHLDVLKYLRHHHSYKPVLDWDEDAMCSEAANSGNLEMLQWLRARKPWPVPWDRWPMWYAAAQGHVHIILWARAQDPPAPWNFSACTIAATCGQLDSLKCLRSFDPPCEWTVDASAAAAERGIIDVLEWMRSQKPPCPWDESLCNRSAAHGQLDAIKWARAQTPPCPWQPGNVMRIARRDGFVELFDWVRENS